MIPLNAIGILCYSLHSAIDCGDPGTPTNGQRSLSTTTYNSVVTYTCDVGYTLQGSNSRTCQSDGQWSGSVPQCTCKLLFISFSSLCLCKMHFSFFITFPSALLWLCIAVCMWLIWPIHNTQTQYLSEVARIRSPFHSKRHHAAFNDAISTLPFSRLCFNIRIHQSTLWWQFRYKSLSMWSLPYPIPSCILLCYILFFTCLFSCWLWRSWYSHKWPTHSLQYNLQLCSDLHLWCRLRTAGSKQ